MNLLQKGFKKYVDCSIHVAIAVVALVAITLMEFDLKLDPDLLLFTFFAAVAGYNFIKYYQSIKDGYKNGMLWKQCWLYVSLIAGIAAIYFMLSLDQRVYSHILFFSILSVAYVIPLFGKKLRGIPGVKMLIVAAVWAGMTVLIPIVNSGLSMGYDHWFSFVQRILIVWALMVPFEIRDLQTDQISLGTMPQRFGVRAVKWQATLAIMAVLLLDQVKFNINLEFTVMSAVILSITLLSIWMSKVKQSTYYASFWVEAIPILWCVLLYASKNYLSISS